MIQSISKQEFQDAFTLAGKRNHFSTEALNTLFDYLKEQENEDTPYILDVIALCEDFKEYRYWNNFKADYPVIAEKCDKRSYRIGTSAIEELERFTAVIDIPNSGFLVSLPITTKRQGKS